MMPDPLLLFAAGAILLGLAMVAVWRLALRIQNPSIVDVAWGMGFVAMALLYGIAGDGWPVRRVMFSLMYGVSGLRLGLHLWQRVARQHPAVDGRYAQLRADWGEPWEPKLLRFYLAQAGLILLLTIPLLLVTRHATHGVHAVEWAGFGLWILAILGEAAADRQLSRFKESQDEREVCREGLWRYSRHPNYFFEWLTWCAYALFAAASPWGWMAVLAPALMAYFLFRVTGIPLTEEQAVRSKGDAYRQYQRETSMFVPWFPRSRWS